MPTKRPSIPTFGTPDPARLARTAPEVCLLPTGTRLWRIYFRGGRYPTRWSAFRFVRPSDKNRFDHHEEPKREQARGIVYCAPLIPVCIAEVFQRDRTLDRHAGEPWLVGFSTVRELALLDLTSRWPLRAGASQEINDGPRRLARAWSRGIYTAFPEIAGLCYRSKMHGGLSVALYERAAAALPDTPILHEVLASLRLFDSLRRVAHDLGYDLA